ncbi:hypothetical protein L9F63_018360, partial [Diploptera punctata]
ILNSRSVSNCGFSNFFLIVAAPITRTLICLLRRKEISRTPAYRACKTLTLREKIQAWTVMFLHRQVLLYYLFYLMRILLNAEACRSWIPCQLIHYDPAKQELLTTLEVLMINNESKHFWLLSPSIRPQVDLPA